MAKSHLETSLADQLAELPIDPPAREYRFHPTRRWRFDFAWPAQRVAAEIQGGVWTGGKHVRGAAYSADCDKLNEAQLLGWVVLYFTSAHIRDRSAAETIRQALLYRETIDYDA